VLAEVAAGNPVIVLQNLALDWYPMWHYAVVVGYDLENHTIILRSGTEPRQVLPLTTFERTWARSKYWAMLVLPPHVLPQTIGSHAYVQAVVALEKAGFAAEARAAYEAALDRWPDNLTALMGAGNTAYAQGDPAAAERAFRRAAELHPASDAALNNLAQVLADQGRLTEAEAMARSALALSGPNSVVAAQTLRDIRQLSVSRRQP
jgi:tetratricopeptide (TPR) repeat protein